MPTINSSIVGTKLTFFALELCALLFWKHIRFYINRSGFRRYWASPSSSFDEIPQQLKNELKVKGYNLIHLKPVKPVKPPKIAHVIDLILMRFQRISFTRRRHNGVTSSVFMYSSSCLWDYSTKKVNSVPSILLTIYLQQAMSVVGFNSTSQSTILKLVSAILHLGNINFKEENNVAVPVSDNSKYKSLTKSYRSLGMMSSLRKEPTFCVTITNFPRNVVYPCHYPSLGSALDG